MNKNSIIITIKKELRSILRDKKNLITLLVFPILIPLMIFLYSYIYDNQTQDEFYNIAVNYELNTTEKSLLKDCYLNPKYYKLLAQYRTNLLKHRSNNVNMSNKKPFSSHTLTSVTNNILIINNQ